MPLGQLSTDDWQELSRKNPLLIPHGASISEAGSTLAPRTHQGFFLQLASSTVITCLIMYILLGAFPSISVLIFCYSFGWWERDSCPRFMEMTRHPYRVDEITGWTSHLYSQLGRTLHATQSCTEIAFWNTGAKQGLWEAGSIVSRESGTCWLLWEHVICLNNYVG